MSGCPTVPHSKGILVDGGMRNGEMHGDGIGVYVYARKPWECFFFHSILQLTGFPWPLCG